MQPIPIHSEETLRQHLPMSQQALAAVEQAFTWLAEDRAVMPPVLHLGVDQRGDVDVKTAYVRGEDRFAVKIAAGFFGNLELGLPTGSGLMVVLSALTGRCEAILLDNGYLTDLRTGLAGAVAAKHLAPRALETVGVVGCGAQARFQIEALRLVRSFERLLVSARSEERAEAYCQEMSDRLGPAIEVAQAASLEQLVRESGFVVTTTPSRAPLIEARWLHPALHITAMGSDGPGKQEVDPECLRRADLVVCDSRDQASRLGELQHLDPAVADADTLSAVVELGELTSGRRPGRESESSITVCDLTGVGAQDTAIALHALGRLAKESSDLASGAGST